MRRIEERESLCDLHFRTNGPYWHIWTSENHPIVFATQSDFMAAMSIMGIAARLCPAARIITFEWMSNHVHIVAAGKKEDILALQQTIKRLLVLHFNGSRYERKHSRGSKDIRRTLAANANWNDAKYMDDYSMSGNSIGRIGGYRDGNGRDDSSESDRRSDSTTRESGSYRDSNEDRERSNRDIPKRLTERFVDLSNFRFSSRELKSLTETRNVIAYDNRNGYLVSPDESPYSYPWGSNRYYFNPDAKALFELSERRTTVAECRSLIFSHISDKIKSLRKVHGYACPMDFCHISEGEKLFASASQYFHSVSRSVESYKSIAEELSESIFLTDEEMFSTACSIASSKYQSKLADLDRTAKVEVARTMHFDYNASNKQIVRILKLPISLVDTMFPK